MSKYELSHGTEPVSNGRGTKDHARKCGPKELSHLSDKVAIDLTPHEIELGANIGIQRECDALKRGARQNHGASASGGIVRHVEGALAEMAVAKALGWYWSGDNGPFKAADIGKDVQVRCSSHRDGRLIIRGDDNPDHRYIFVTGLDGHYVIHGWIYGRDAYRLQWFTTVNNERPPAYFVPQNALRPISEFRKE